MGKSNVELNETSLKALLEPTSSKHPIIKTGRGSISHKDAGVAGSLIARRQWSAEARNPVIVFYFRNQAEDNDQLIKIGVWAGAGRNKKESGIDHKEALSIYRQWGKIANDHPDLKAYLNEQEAKEKREQAELARLAEIEAKKGTVEHLLNAYLESMKNKVSYKEVISVFKNVPEELRAMYAKDVLSEHITKVIANYVQQPVRGGGIGNMSNTNASASKHTTGDKIRRYLSAAFNFGMKADNDPLHHVQQGKIFSIAFNPVAAVKSIDPKNADTRCIEHGELLALLEAIHQLEPLNRALALTHVYFGGQRIRQLFSAKWPDITDNSILLIDTKGRGKTKQTSEHLLPITPKMTEILKPLYEANRYAPSPFSLNGRTKVNPDTIGDMFISLNNRLMAQGKADKFTAKHIRVACETYLASKGFSREDRAWLLSHGRTGVQAKHYDRYSHWQEKVTLLTVWQSFLDELQGNNVVAVNFGVSAA
jgi:integrase